MMDDENAKKLDSILRTGYTYEEFELRIKVKFCFEI